MINFAKRNLKMFFRDKTGVFFSLLGVLIVIALFAFFLGDTYQESMQDVKDADQLINSWIVAGILAITSVTTAMGAFGSMVDDKAKNITKDFYSSPIKRKNLVMGYITSSFLIGLIMTLIALVLGELYIVVKGGELLAPLAMIKSLGIITLTSLSNTAMVLFIVSFLNSSTAYSTASTVVGTMIGFVTGIYVPIGNFADSIQYFIKIFPTSHGASLLRQTIMEVPMSNSFDGAPNKYVEEFKEVLGVTFKFGDSEVNKLISVLILIASIVLFSLLSIANLSRKKK
ncbi:MAG: ABC transporter permease [Ruminococcus sp.]|nr:ABC transporter permease [Ruminococcus sp.]